jgi:hypothetical protein
MNSKDKGRIYSVYYRIEYCISWQKYFDERYLHDNGMIVCPLRFNVAVSNHTHNDMKVPGR